MQITSALLCDFAQIREGLLFIASGGITRLNVLVFPSPFQLTLAGMVEIYPTEIDQIHEVRISVANAAEAEELGYAVGALKPEVSKGLLRGESIMMPLIVPLSPIILHMPGAHDVRISVDGELAGHLTCYVHQIVQQE